MARVDTPAVHVRVVLVASKQRHLPFGAAWEAAMRSLPRPDHPALAADIEDWRAQLRATRDAWRECYEAPVSEPASAQSAQREATAPRQSPPPPRAPSPV